MGLSWSSGSSGSTGSTGLFGVDGVVGVLFKYSFIASESWGRNTTAKINIVKIINVPIEVFFLLSNAPIASGFNSSCSIFIFLYF